MTTPKSTPSNPPVSLTIEFPNQDALDAFVDWLDGQGEQDYWEWMDLREENELMVTFDYDNDDRNLITTDLSETEDE